MTPGRFTTVAHLIIYRRMQQKLIPTDQGTETQLSLFIKGSEQKHLPFTMTWYIKVNKCDSGQKQSHIFMNK